MQKRLYDIRWSNEKICQGCDKEEGMEKQRLYLCPVLIGGEKPDHKKNWANGNKGQNLKERFEVAERNHVTVRRWESEKPKKCGIPVEGVRAAGRWCSSITTRRWVSMHGMLDAELEVQRAIKRAELTAFLSLLRKSKVRTLRWFTLITKGLLMVCVKVK